MKKMDGTYLYVYQRMSLDKSCGVQMLLTNYELQIFRAECNPEFQSVHLKAVLKNNIEAVLPYLNSALGGFTYYRNPDAVTFKHNGRLITVQGREIAINALKDADEARKVFQWLVNEINQTWEKREDIVPSFESVLKPKVVDILRYLPKTNCGKCTFPTCMVFAVRLCDGVYSEKNCPEMNSEARSKLSEYLSRFSFDE